MAIGQRPTRCDSAIDVLNTEIPSHCARAVAQLKQFYFALTERANALLRAEELNAEWGQRRSRIWKRRERALPFRQSGPGSGVAFEYDDVTLAEADWQTVRGRLMLVRDFATALGMHRTRARRRRCHSLPRQLTRTFRDWNHTLAEQLQTNFPKLRSGRSARFPTPCGPISSDESRKSIDQGNRDGQQVILGTLGMHHRRQEPDAGRLGPRRRLFLLSPSRREWRDLLAFVARLADPKAEDPVATTAAFLKKPSFELEAEAGQIANSRHAQRRPRAAIGRLESVSPQARRRRTRDHFATSSTGEPERDKQSVVYTFAAVGNPAIKYRPGRYVLRGVAGAQGRCVI